MPDDIRYEINRVLSKLDDIERRQGREFDDIKSSLDSIESELSSIESTIDDLKSR